MIARALVLLLLLLAAAVPWRAAPAQGTDAGCVKCHKELAQGKSVHAAPKAGCAACHQVLEGGKAPHGSATGLPLGLVAKGDALCAKCHDESASKKKFRHRAMKSGCTYCHNPHASEHEKLLTASINDVCVDCHEEDPFQTKAKGRHRALSSGCTYCHAPHAADRKNLLTMEPAQLCRDCHDEDEFAAKARHAPVREGKCLECHLPHASEQPMLLTQPKQALCLQCHDAVAKTPHAVAGFSRAGHPVGGEKPGVKDPAQREQPFGCASCHDSHRSTFADLLRFDPLEPHGFCEKCHRM